MADSSPYLYGSSNACFIIDSIFAQVIEYETRVSKINLNAKNAAGEWLRFKIFCYLISSIS